MRTSKGQIVYNLYDLIRTEGFLHSSFEPGCGGWRGTALNITKKSLMNIWPSTDKCSIQSEEMQPGNNVHNNGSFV